jgi:phospho-N-acetylmuramoyl-pentapeptide-transferase
VIRYLALAGEWFGPLRVFESTTLRAALATVLAFVIAIILGPGFIRRLAGRQATEDVSKPDAQRLEELHGRKKGTPTMGGILLVAAVGVSIILCCDPTQPLVWVGLLVLLGFGGLGFCDDFWKLRGWGKQGLTKRHKFLAESVLALLTVIILAWGTQAGWFGMTPPPPGDSEGDFERVTNQTSLIIPTRLVVPFTKWNSVNPDLGLGYWLFAFLIIVACANAVNLTDGLDGLAGGCTAMVSLTYAFLAYVAGNAIAAAFFRIPMVPGAAEISIYGAALFGGILGFLWFNANPADVFMGDTGSLALGAALAFMAIVTKHELTLVLAGGIFVFEALSVILQVGSFRLLGRRLFRIAPFHHHLEYNGWKENHVVVRLWIISIILSIMSLGLLKMH